jgi:enoyl-CoA hydratase / long-chain 3-hydroxyacyl-CoA dehydrogenase
MTWSSCVILCRFDANRVFSNLEPTLSYQDFGKVDMVIEAVFEDIKIKHAVIKELEKVSNLL